MKLRNTDSVVSFTTMTGRLRTPSMNQMSFKLQVLLFSSLIPASLSSVAEGSILAPSSHASATCGLLRRVLLLRPLPRRLLLRTSRMCRHLPIFMKRGMLGQQNSRISLLTYSVLHEGKQARNFS
ncbi:hypothetical protein CRG98_014001 [Punica granatum]|uniref:Uncharacterized protein n=1 Tax=Punica granatum TaxID=22663 RepID=A0A2I0KAP0_PUNGR|nr:hypothetical protein CRG98_014001 [Punica granatum]